MGRRVRSGIITVLAIQIILFPNSRHRVRRSKRVVASLWRTAIQGALRWWRSSYRKTEAILCLSPLPLFLALQNFRLEIFLPRFPHLVEESREQLLSAVSNLDFTSDCIRAGDLSRASCLNSLSISQLLQFLF